MVTAKQIESVVDEIARRFKPERVILFGSYAYGKPTEDSDVDLLVVKRHKGSEMRAASRIRIPLDVGFPMDLLVRSPAEIRRRVEWKDFFILDILEQGLVLYEALNRAMGLKGRRRLRHRLEQATVTKAQPV